MSLSRISSAVRAALPITGWMDEPELRWLAEMAAGRERVVEFGCYNGRSTKAIAGACRGVVHAVDYWPGAMAVDVLPVFRANLAEEIASGRVVVHHCDTASFMPAPGAEPDMVFIDADHDYERVLGDIIRARYFMRRPGLLCGHDFSASYPGVMQAVAEVLPGFRRGPGSIWYKELEITP